MENCIKSTFLKAFLYLENGLGTVKGKLLRSHSLRLVWHLGQDSGNVKAKILTSQWHTHMMSDASDILAGMLMKKN